MKNYELESCGDLFSIGYLSGKLQRSPAEVFAAAAEMNFKPLCIDAIPYFNNEQANAIANFLERRHLVPVSEINRNASTQN